MENTYLGVVLTDDLYCAIDIERTKKAFFKQFRSMYHKFSFVGKIVLLHIFRLHAMSFYSAETPENISVSYHKTIKRINGTILYDRNDESFEEVNLPSFKHFLAKQQFLAA